MSMIVGAILGALVIVSLVVGFCAGAQMTAKEAKKHMGEKKYE